MEQKKVLVIDDEAEALEAYLDYGKGFFDTWSYSTRMIPNYSKLFRVYDMDLGFMEEKLRTIPYVAILLDGKLGLHLRGNSSAKSDGDVIARNIVCGNYGILNRETPIYSISDSFDAFSSYLGVKNNLFKATDRKGVERTIDILELERK